MHETAQHDTNLSKLATGFAILLLVSFGLCAANASLFSHFGAVSGGTPSPPRSANFSVFLMATGAIELIGMAIGAGGLLVTLVWAIGRAIIKGSKTRD